ncbi:exonuclease V like protein [Babesia gibsoni]|uniref:Exonuclease V like protein n=1 Tax=Babesia gibsoni TaxID=33632 RepID=A0AAD8LHY0_BABGI|nr:exonuclease V like protein [Babesia gibsoni]
MVEYHQGDVKKRKTYRIAVKEEDTNKTLAENNEEREATTPERADFSEIDSLIPDIEDLIQDSLSHYEEQESVELPPVIKYRKNWSLSVTDLSSQLWCEKQIELTLITGRKRVTKEMELGIERHEQLELEDHEVVEVQVETSEDYLGIKLLNSINLIDQLLETGKCREIWVFGNFNGYVIRGIIDQLEILPPDGIYGKRVFISDTKTRRAKRKPSLSQMQGASLQVQAYCMILDKLRNGNESFDGIYKAFECNKEAPFTSPELLPEGCLASLEQKFLSAFRRLPQIATTMQLSYEHAGEIFDTTNIQLQEDSTLYTINYLFNFWDGLREAEAVSKQEVWKCKMCEFKHECDKTPLRKPLARKNSLSPGQARIEDFFKKEPIKKTRKAKE